MPALSHSRPTVMDVEYIFRCASPRRATEVARYGKRSSPSWARPEIRDYFLKNHKSPAIESETRFREPDRAIPD